MSKYGSGISIKEYLTLEVESIKDILNHSQLSEEHQSEIISSFKELAYQYCKANGLACVLEDIVNKYRKELGSDSESNDLVWAVIIGKLTDQKVSETYPFLEDD